MPKLPELDDAQKKQIAETLKYWAGVHPQPDKEAAFIGLEKFTPRKLAEAAGRPETELGRYVYYRFAAMTVTQPGDKKPALSLNETLAGYRKDADKWVAAKKPAAAKKPGGPAPL